MEEPFILNNRNQEIRKKEEILKNYGFTGDIYLRANFISKIFFYWGFRLIRLANKISLKKEYLGHLEGKQKSEVYMNDLYNIWDNKGYKDIKKYKLLKTTLRANICKYLLTT
jgi:hypothetical protein